VRKGQPKAPTDGKKIYWCFDCSLLGCTKTSHNRMLSVGCIGCLMLKKGGVERVEFDLTSKALQSYCGRCRKVYEALINLIYG